MWALPEEERSPIMSAMLIEKVVKVYKTHRDTSDIDTGYIRRIVNNMMEID